MIEPLIIEVRVNEWALRDRNIHIPYAPAEIAQDARECRHRGASIIHFHARDPQTGAPSADPAAYAEIVHRIRDSKDSSDLILAPTNIPPHRNETAPSDMKRIEAIMQI